MSDLDLYPRMAGDGLMWTVTNVQRGAQGFALHRLSSVRFPKQGKALRSALHLCSRARLVESTLVSVTTRVQGGALRYEACKLSGGLNKAQATASWVKIR